MKYDKKLINIQPIVESIINEVNDYLEIDCMKATRKRDYVDARSIVIKILHDDYHLGWTTMVQYFDQRDTPIGTHATLIHLYKRFDQVIKYNSRVEASYNQIVSERITTDSTENLLNRIRNIKDFTKFSKIEKCIENLK